MAEGGRGGGGKVLLNKCFAFDHKRYAGEFLSLVYKLFLCFVRLSAIFFLQKYCFFFSFGVFPIFPYKKNNVFFPRTCWGAGGL